MTKYSDYSDYSNYSVTIKVVSKVYLSGCALLKPPSRTKGVAPQSRGLSFAHEGAIGTLFGCYLNRQYRQKAYRIIQKRLLTGACLHCIM